MNIKEIYKEILSGNTVLITGSGANVGVKNHNGDAFPVGSALPELLYKQCGINAPDNPYDLQDASETFLERKTANELIKLLRQTFNVGELSETVKIIYSMPWMRCYTTNYDEVPLLASDRRLLPVTINQSTKKLIAYGACCVYINGYLGRLDEKSLFSEFKLTKTSYLSMNNILASQWGSVFKDDLECATRIIVTGLSLEYDLDLERILQDKTLAEKVVFIEKEGITEDKKRKLGRFGTVIDIGLERFAIGLDEYKRTEFIQTNKENRLICFERNSRKNVQKEATSREVYELLMRGELANNLFWREAGKYKALIYRDQVYNVIDAIDKRIKLVFIHANLGNGKGIFLEQLKQQLYSKGISVYTLLEENNKREIADIEKIMSETGPKVVIIENYFNHIDVLRIFSRHNCEDLTFVLTARTMVYEVKLIETCELFDVKSGESVIFDINKLSRKEIQNCYNILQKYEFWGNMTGLPTKEKIALLTKKTMGNCELQSILLAVINSSTIREKINEIIKKIEEESSDYYHAIILMLISKVMSLELRIKDISSIEDQLRMFDVRFVKNDAIQELVTFNSNGKMDYRIKSSIIAKVILNGIDNSAEIIDALKKIAIYANRYSENVRYESILQNIVSFSHVNSFLNGKRDNIDFIMDYYDTLKDIEYYRENSFFWLQYSIACMRYKNFELAQNYIDVAYGKFRENEVNVPFQCDNQQARIYLEQIKYGKSKNISEDFEKAHRLAMQPLFSEKDREETTIRLFKTYVDRRFVEQINRENLLPQYQKYCGEAYNKITIFLKRLRNERDRERYNSLQNALLRACSNT